MIRLTIETQNVRSQSGENANQIAAAAAPEYSLFLSFVHVNCSRHCVQCLIYHGLNYNYNLLLLLSKPNMSAE